MIHAALWATTLAAAAVVGCVPGLAGATRDALGLALRPHPGSLEQAATILATNARATALIFIAAAVAARLRPLRAPLDAWVIATLALNAMLVGAALGAHGTDAVPWLVHLPLEWAALARTATHYLHARGRRRRASTARSAAAVAALLVAAALVESYATPQ